MNQYYHRLGYFDIDVKHHLEFSQDKSKVQIHFLVDEGVRYKIRKIEVSGVILPGEEEIRKRLDLRVKSDLFFNKADIERDVDSIKTVYDRNGLLLTCVDAIPAFTEEEGVVDLFYRISPALAVPNESNVLD